MDLLGAGLAPMPGGFSGETFLAEAAGERTVVRIYAARSAERGPNAAEVDAAVLRLVRGLVPVPEVLEVRRADPGAGTPALLVTSFLEGERLDSVLPTASDELARALGESVGSLLARLSQMPMLRGGVFLDGDLRIGPAPAEVADLVEWARLHLDGTALAHWPADDRERLLAVADDAQSLLDTVDRVSLVHSDFNAKNLLVDPATGGLTGVLDWEYSHAGHPFTDLGNVLRFERDPRFVDAVLSTYCSLAPDLPGMPRPTPSEALDLARAGDLLALVELASRRDQHDVAHRAHDHLLAIARAGDLHATS